MNTLENSEKECAICYETIAGKNNCTTRCGHAFCLHCMIQSLKINTTCPICRNELDERPELSTDSDSESDDEYVEREYVDPDYMNDDDREDDDREDYGREDESYSNDYASTSSEEEEEEVEIETLVDAFVKHGYDLKDAMSILFSKYSKIDPKYTEEYIFNLEDNFDYLYKRLLMEKGECKKMFAEDIPA